jgi:aryl-alcohol dehydrogenase-like predicted oxidoreductase
MSSSTLSRRQFVHGAAAATAAVAAGVVPARTVYAGNPTNEKTDGILNYNEQMEYRRGGKTGLMFSAVCLGGHWKRVNAVVPDAFGGKSWLSASVADSAFLKNRYDVVTQCIERGINYIDACTEKEVLAYSKALTGRRDKMVLGCSWHPKESRKPEWRTCEKLKQAMDEGLRDCGLEYVDVWRITCHEQSSRHTEAEMEEAVRALDWAKKTGRARFTGFSSHDRPHIKMLIQKYPDQIDAICTPYTAKTKLAGAKIERAEEGDSTRVVRMDAGAWENSLWYAMQQAGVAWFGIKPFASNSIFKGDSAPGNEFEEEDNKIARLTLRAILTNPVITAPIPGLITAEQVDNAALAVLQRRALDVEEQAQLDAATDRAFRQLPYHYRWLSDWEYV